MLSNTAYCKLIYQYIDEGIIVVSQGGTILWVNESLEKIFGYESGELLNKPLDILIPKAFIGSHDQKRKSYIKNPIPRPRHHNLEFEGIRKDGKPIWLKIGLNSFEDDGEVYSIAQLTNVTDKRLAEINMQKYADRAKLFLKLSKTIFLELDQKGNIQLINDEGCLILGVSQDEAVGLNWFNTFISDHDRPRIKLLFNELINGRISDTKIVTSSIESKSGEKRLIQWHNTVIKNEKDKITGTLSSGIDITEQEALKKSQNNIVLLATEKERKRVAMELHDGVIQTLSAVSMNLKSIKDAIFTLPESNQKAFEEGLNLVLNTISEIRAISHDLMPSIIINHGLEKALNDLIERTTETNNIMVNYQSDGLSKSLDQMYALNIYRILQELIQNTIKHAEADSISIQIQKIEEFIQIIYQDNGIGFNTKLHLDNSEGMGIQNIKARIDSMNGDITIESSKGKGVIIMASLPITDEILMEQTVI